MILVSGHVHMTESGKGSLSETGEDYICKPKPTCGLDRNGFDTRHQGENRIDVVNSLICGVHIPRQIREYDFRDCRPVDWLLSQESERLGLRALWNIDVEGAKISFCKGISGVISDGCGNRTDYEER